MSGVRRLIVAGLLCACAPLAGAQNEAPAPAAATPAAEPAPAEAAPAAPVPQVEIIDTRVGKGREAAPGDGVLMHYTGWLLNPKAKNRHGKKFDSTFDAGRTPIAFKLGVGQVIQGWEKGVPGMKVGGKRTLVIPPELGYGARGAGAGVIPPNATLVFDIELLKVR